MIETGQWTRRAALQGAAITALAALPARANRPPASAPILATPEQLDAERNLLALLPDEELGAIQRQLADELRAKPRGATADGAARTSAALAQWTNAVIFGELASYRPGPAFLWGTDDTPRTWFGHTIGGVGTAGDNPDNIYRSAVVDGNGRYEITGRFDRRPAAQFSMEIVAGTPTDTVMVGQSAKHADLGTQIAMITDRDLNVRPDGSFRLLLGAGPRTRDQVPLRPGSATVGVRDSLSDWVQRPARLSIRRLDDAAPPRFERAELRRRVIAKLPAYVRFWSDFGDKWFGGLAPNAIARPIPRDGGWGFVSGFRYRLLPGEALVVTTGRGAAAYTGFQITDPWMIAPDARIHQASLNLSQAVPDEDGRTSYVVAAADPGFANWIDTSGLHEGFGVLRWQGLPPGATADELLHTFQVVPASELTALRGLARITPAERRARLAARAAGYRYRLT